MARITQAAVVKISFILGACAESLTAGVKREKVSIEGDEGDVVIPFSRVENVRKALSEASALLALENEVKEPTWKPSK